MISIISVNFLKGLYNMYKTRGSVLYIIERTHMTHMYAHIHTYRQFYIQIHLISMNVDWEKKPEHSTKTICKG